jgi:hypothetical protein
MHAVTEDGTANGGAPAAPSSRIAVSIKQPWATLVVFGMKTIELRRWRPRRTGCIYIHTGAQADRSKEAWSLVPASLASFAKLRQGLVGRVHLAGSKPYRSLEEFRADATLHRAPEEWFTPHGLTGWLLEKPEAIPFEPCRGNLRFFRV